MESLFLYIASLHDRRRTPILYHLPGACSYIEQRARSTILGAVRVAPGGSNGVAFSVRYRLGIGGARFDLGLLFL